MYPKVASGVGALAEMDYLVVDCIGVITKDEAVVGKPLVSFFTCSFHYFLF